MRHDDRRSLESRNDAGRGKGLTRPGHPEQCLMHQTILDALH